jgi:uncharacterized protein involved in outer membrane biogenesis
MARRTRSRVLRISLWSLAGLFALAIAGTAFFALSFDPDRLKPRIIAAVKQATGRDLTLQGHIRLGLSLRPTLIVQGASLANPPGFSRPQMVTLERLEINLALIPLLSHSVEINRLVLVKPDIVLETDAQGRPNWQFTSETGTAAPRATAAGTQDRTAERVSVADLRIENGTVTWQDGRAGRSAMFSVANLRASAPSPDANLHVMMSATYSGTPFTLAGEFGPLVRLQGGAWPVQAQLEAAGAKLAVDGTVSEPLQGRGYRLNLTATVPDMAALAPLLPGAGLPSLRDVSLVAQVADTGAVLPELSGLTLHAGKSDLTGTVAGLRLDQLDVAVARIDQPVQVSARGSFNDLPASLTGSLGAPAALLSAATVAGPIPVDLDVQALGSHLMIKGTAAGGQGGTPSVQGKVASDRIDLDSLLAALGKMPAPAVAGPAAATAKPATTGRVIPDTPLPFDLLHLADVDVKLSIAELISGGATYRAIATHLDLQGGRLRLDPLSADLPAGHVDGSLSADATQAAPAMALRLRVPALVLQSLLAAMGKPAFASGNLNVQADLRGAGATPHAIAASLDGSLSLGLAGGTVDNRLLGSELGSILRAVNLFDLVGRGGTSQVQCFTARLDANHGIATLRSLVFASTLLTMDGSGSLNLGAETLDLHLRPQAKLAGAGIVVPVRIGGSFRSPSAASDPGALVTQNAGSVAGAILGGATPLGLAAGVLGAKQLFGGSETDCGSVGTAAPAGQAAPQQQKLPNVGGLLKELFR